MIFFQLPFLLIKRYRFRQLLFVLLTISLILGILVVPFEYNLTGASITNIGDGLWWASSTVTSVGYGDVVPVSWQGKVIGTVLQFLGILVYSSLVGLVTMYINETKVEYNWQKVLNRLDQLDQQLRQISKQSAFLISNQSNLNSKQGSTSNTRDLIIKDSNKDRNIDSSKTLLTHVSRLQLNQVNNPTSSSQELEITIPVHVIDQESKSQLR